jgi:type IV secretion system protein VirB6
MNSVLVTSLNQIQPQIAVALGLHVVMQGILMSLGSVSLSSAIRACIRCVLVVAILQLPNYLFYVAQFFFTDLPNQLGAAVGGARTAIDSARQFDTLWDGVTHYRGYVLSLATGVFDTPKQLITYFDSGLMYVELWVMFVLWYITRVYMALTLCVGPFIILLFLWDATRGYVQRWIGMLLGLTMLSLTSTILLRILLVLLNNGLAALKYDAADFTVAENALEGMVGIFGFGMIMMVALPATGFALGAGAGTAITSGMLFSAGARTVGGGIRGAGRLGAALGRRV